MKIDILTLFPEMFDSVFQSSILGRAQKAGLVTIAIHNLRNWATDKHKTVDDTPYGGGPGMVLRVDVIDRALYDLKSQVPNSKPKVILLTPQGEKFDQRHAQLLSQIAHLILIAGHYEGFDERVRALVDEELSIGDYILTGGELPAMVITDAVVRLLPGALGKDESTKEESFAISTPGYPRSTLLEYPHYTRPESYRPISISTKRPLTVPKILKSGDHAKIAVWRHDQARKRTLKRRPDLIN